MVARLNHRAGHVALLALVWALLCLPNLGGPSLWDVDEGNNVECSFEMLQSGNAVVPTFNYKLRGDKPALLYWLQGAAYRACGVNEFAARLPSALAALLAILATYELGRHTFGKRAALLAGLILASAVAFSGAAHFANPDALLTAFTAASLLLFWHDYRRGGAGWLPLAGATTGLAVLAKGPVGLVLPAAVAHLFLLWRGQWRQAFDRRLLGATLLFVAVAAPWYVWVSLETKGEWLRQFWYRHHAERLTTPLENHGGPVYYYLLALLAGLAPWSAFLGPAAWHALRRLRDRGEAGQAADAPRAAVQFLLCWVAVYFLFFSLVRTKLPNYVLPLYPPAALLLAFSLDRWRRGLVRGPAWVVGTSLGCLALLGVGVGLGLLVAGGAVDLPLVRGRRLPGLEAWAALGGVLPAAALAGGWCAWRGRRGAALACLTVAAVLFTSALGAFAVNAVDRYKAPRPLVRALPADQLYHEVRVGAYAWFRPSVVFYCRREVVELEHEQEALAFLEGPLPSYLFLPAQAWEGLEAKTGGQCRLVARHHDLYGGCDVVVVSNKAGAAIMVR
jgi:4-amino-4-deoxy-L-arabinose transferase-like glycosyltransferase